MAQYDAPVSEVLENIDNSDMSAESKQAVQTLFEGKDDVVVAVFDSANPPVGADLIIVPEGVELTGDPGGAVVIFQGQASGSFEVSDDTPRLIVAQGDDNQNITLTGSGTATVETGAGFDVVTLDNENGREDHGFEVDANGNVIILGSNYTLEGVEAIQFSDGLSVIAQDEDQAIVARMYQILFDREPDMEGLEYWFDTLQDASFGDGTYDMWDVTHAFMNSDEFSEKYAGLDDEEFLTNLYLGMTGREADADGMAYWLDVMADPEAYIGTWKGDEDNAQVHVTYAFAFSEEANQAMGLDGSKYIIPVYDMDE